MSVGGGFTKLFGSIVTSTVWRESDKTRIVWITMLALADRNGYVGGSVPGLAALANMTTEECHTAILRLMAPDEWSRTKTHEGRRIEEADGGWVLLNYKKYRELSRSVDRTEYMRKAKEKSRAKASGQPTSTNVNQLQPIAEAEAEAEAEIRNATAKATEPDIGSLTLASPRLAGAAAVIAHYQGYHPRARVKPKSKEHKLILAQLDAGYSVDDLKHAIDGYHRDPFHMGVNDTGTKYLGLGLIMRDADHVTKGIEMPASVSATSEKEKRGQLAAASFLARGTG